MLSDEALAARVRQRRRAGLRAAVRPLPAAALHRYCASILRQSEDAEEALQSAMLAAYLALAGGGPRDVAVRPWLYRIAHNQCVDMLRRRPARPPGALTGDEVLAAPGVAERARSPTTCAGCAQDLLALPDRAARRARPARALGPLPRPDRRGARRDPGGRQAAHLPGPRGTPRDGRRSRPRLRHGAAAHLRRGRAACSARAASAPTCAPARRAAGFRDATAGAPGAPGGPRAGGAPGRRPAPARGGPRPPRSRRRRGRRRRRRVGRLGRRDRRHRRTAQSSRPS